MQSVENQDPDLLFISNNSDMNRGTYRIMINYLSKSLKSIGAKVRVCSINDEIPVDADVVVFDKGISGESIKKIKERFKEGTLIGALNPSAGSQLPVDFATVGSRLEESTLSNYPNIIIVPLIEPSLHSLPLKDHIDNEIVKVCYHGNSLHLSSFQSCGLKDALERYEKELFSVNRKLILTVISNKEKPRWLIGKPDIEIKYVKYDWKTFPNLLTEHDIGIVPNCYYKKPLGTFTYFHKKVLNMELANTDLIIRLKNKSNFGRLLVFMQAGIPTVADLTPSHLELLGDPLNGFCASNEQGWLRAFRALSIAAERNEIAKNAKTFVSSNYEPLHWARRFMVDIKKINYNKTKKHILITELQNEGQLQL